MKIQQQNLNFQPITITIETAKELEMLQQIIDIAYEETNPEFQEVYNVSKGVRGMIIALVDSLTECNIAEGIDKDVKD